MCTAAVEGSLEVVRWLIEEQGADVLGTNLNDAGPFLLAALNGHLGTLKYLWDKKYVVNVDVTDNYGNTALSLSARTGQYETVAWLIAHGANVLHRNNAGKTANMLALAMRGRQMDQVTRKRYDSINGALERAEQRHNVFRRLYANYAPASATVKGCLMTGGLCVAFFALGRMSCQGNPAAGSQPLPGPSPFGQ